MNILRYIYIVDVVCAMQRCIVHKKQNSPELKCTHNLYENCVLFVYFRYIKMHKPRNRHKNYRSNYYEKWAVLRKFSIRAISIQNSVYSVQQRQKKKIYKEGQNANQKKCTWSIFCNCWPSPSMAKVVWCVHCIHPKSFLVGLHPISIFKMFSRYRWWSNPYLHNERKHNTTLCSMNFWILFTEKVEIHSNFIWPDACNLSYTKIHWMRGEKNTTTEDEMFVFFFLLFFYIIYGYLLYFNR